MTCQFGVVLLAAGASRRMSSCKLLLPWGEGTILSHLLEQWRSIGTAQIAPVIDPSNQPLRDALKHAGFSPATWIENPKPERGMFSSLREASRWQGWKDGLTHWIVSLGDQPHIQFSTLQTLLDSARENPARICQPAFSGKTAHPIVLPMKEFRTLEYSNVSDLRNFLRNHESIRIRVTVKDAGILGDLDTPADYARWSSRT